MKYEELLIESESDGMIVKELPLKSADGRCKGNRIAIRNDISTTVKKSVTLAEEMGHFHTTTGDITRLSDVQQNKQEYRARLWAYDKHIGLMGLINAFKHGCHNRYEIAEYLEVTEDFLVEALESYKRKYGICTSVDNYTIFFIPALAIMEKYI